MSTHKHQRQHPAAQAAPRHQHHHIVAPDSTPAPTTTLTNVHGCFPPPLSYEGAPYEPLVYSTSNTGVIYEDPASISLPLSLYPSLTHHLARRDSTGWSDAGLGPLATGVVVGTNTTYGGGVVVGSPDNTNTKFPGIGDADFNPKGFVTYSGTGVGVGVVGGGGAYMLPSTASSVTGLSTISRTSSVGSVSVCSPTVTEPSLEHNSNNNNNNGSAPSRFPSPLRKSTTPECAMPGANAPRGRNAHVCLWGNNGVCESRGFTTRAELNRHVKMEHLLECPVPGCTETVFETRDLLVCHVQWDHNNSNDSPKTGVCRTANLIGGGNLAAQPEISNELPAGSTPVAKRVDAAEDKILKMEMSIGISKRRCREQLRTVLEKRMRRVNGYFKSADSPGIYETRTPKLLESANFPIVWEHGVLPFLIEFLPKWCGPGHVISVIRGRKPNTRRICIMTKRPIKTARRIVIAAHVRDLLPETYRCNISFVFSVGKVDRLVWSRGLSKEMPDEVCVPRNPFAYISPCMGDSIGASLDDGEEATATLGPCVTAEGGSYWLACFHPFIGATQRTSPILIEHPSPQDRAQCAQDQHDVLHDLDHRVGNLTATSGYDLKTTRVTHDPYWEDLDKEPPLVVTDWILISSGTRQANLLRRFPTVAQRRETPVTSTTSVSPGANVFSTGRTSGFGRGQICEVPAYVDSEENGTGKSTREWFVEEPFPYENENEWIRGGIGVEGDSGAAIIDSDTNALVGQLWGRNKYWGPGPRMTFFTPMSDIFDDIQEKCGMSARPQLPQYRDEAERYPVYPVCRQCYDIREYLDSRRSSRESLMSMIGMHDTRGEHDNDLTSVSELATPKDQSSLMRHIGPDETASMFGGGSVVSPAPVHAFYSFPQAASPGMSELRSPYPHTLSDEDLYESSCPQSSDVALGKRPAVLPPQGQGITHHAEKRRKPTYSTRV